MSMLQVWSLPVLLTGLLIGFSIPIGRYLAWALDRDTLASGWLARFERRVDTGPQTWKQYAVAMLTFNFMAFAIGFAVLALQPWLPLNPDDKKMLAPTTIFNTACSFLTNTNLQHYSGEVHLSYFSQIFFVCWKQFVTPAIGLGALLAIIRGLRGSTHMGNFYLDVFRSVMYVFLPMSLMLGVVLIAMGVPMTFEGNATVFDEDGKTVLQIIARGPVAAILAIKQLGTNGGGFFGANSSHPFENPSDWSNLLTCWAILILPMSIVVMFGRMLKNMAHARIVYGVMLFLFVGFMAWGVYWDTMKPNPGLAGRAALVNPDGTGYRVDVLSPEGKLSRKPIEIAAIADLPIDQSLGNLEGKELRFGVAAGPTWAAATTCTSNGSVNCMHDSLNPLAGLTPLGGMWLNCAFGGVGVGLINMLLYLVTAVFLAGLMVGRTPEYLGKKIEAREMKLAMLGLLAHPLLILGPVGIFAALDWGAKSTNNPGAHGFSEILYEFSSASANNGSGFEGLADTVGFADNVDAPKYAPHWDIACGLIMMLGRFIPIIAPLALAGSLAGKKRTPFTTGTLRTDTLTFAFVLLGTIILVGALLFLPAAVLGPVAEHLGPLPFGG